MGPSRELNLTNTELQSWQNSWWEKGAVSSSVAAWEHSRAVTGADEEVSQRPGRVWPFQWRGSITVKINSSCSQGGE